MRMAPTLQGGLRLDIESLLDWARLEMICIDASKINTLLSNTLAEKMQIEADWRNYVMPDLDAMFSEQISSIYSTIKTARSRGEEEAELHIDSESADTWYGALNQARLALEEKYGLSKYEAEPLDDLANLTEETKAALMRSNFYAILQNGIIEHAFTIKS